MSILWPYETTLQFLYSTLKTPFQPTLPMHFLYVRIWTKLYAFIHHYNCLNFKLQFLINPESIQTIFKHVSTLCINNNVTKSIQCCNNSISKEIFMLIIMHMGKFHFNYILPLVLKILDKLKSTVGLVVCFPDTILKTWNISPRNLLYFNVGRFKRLKLASYE